MAGDSKLYFRRGLSSPDLTASETAGAGNSLPVRTYANGIGPNGMYWIIKVPISAVDGTKTLTATLKDAADNGSGVPGAFAAVAEGLTLTTTMLATTRVLFAKCNSSREWLGVDFTVTAGSNFGKVASYLGNEVPFYQ